jgi:hypothetical protein
MAAAIPPAIIAPIAPSTKGMTGVRVRARARNGRACISRRMFRNSFRVVFVRIMREHAASPVPALKAVSLGQ